MEFCFIYTANGLLVGGHTHHVSYSDDYDLNHEVNKLTTAANKLYISSTKEGRKGICNIC